MKGTEELVGWGKVSQKLGTWPVFFKKLKGKRGKFMGRDADFKMEGYFKV